MNRSTRAAVLAGAATASACAAVLLAGPAAATVPTPSPTVPRAPATAQVPGPLPTATRTIATAPGALPSLEPGTAPVGGSIQVPAGRAEATPGTPIWETGGLVGVGIALLGGGVAVARRR